MPDKLNLDEQHHSGAPGNDHQAQLQIVHVVEAAGGGVAKHINDVLSGLTRNGIRNHLLYSPRRTDAIFDRALETLSGQGVKSHELGSLKQSISILDFSSLVQIVKFVRRLSGPLVIHGHSSKAGALARVAALICRKRAVYTPHAFVTLSPELSGLQRFMYTQIERMLSRLPAQVVVVSEEEKAEAMRLGYRESRLHVIPNGFNPPTLTEAERTERRTAHRARWGLTDDTFAVGYVGRYAPQKGVGNLISAFAEVAKVSNEHIRLVLIGRGPQKEELVSLADQLGIAKLIIWAESDDGFDTMLGFDMFVLPSLYEGFPYVLLEAMAAGMPLLSTRVGGTSLALTDGDNALVVPPGDVSALAAGLQQLVTNPDQLIMFSARNLERIKNFSEASMISALLRTYDSTG